MGDVPATENRSAGIVNSIERGAINIGMKAAKIAATAAAPFLGWPVISQLVDYVLNKIGDYFYVWIAEHSTFLIIDMQTEAEKKAYLQSVVDLQKAQTSGDQNAIDQAHKKLKEDLARLVRWDGSAHP